MDSPRLHLLEASDRRQPKCIWFESSFRGDPAVTRARLEEFRSFRSNLSQLDLRLEAGGMRKQEQLAGSAHSAR